MHLTYNSMILLLKLYLFLERKPAAGFSHVSVDKLKVDLLRIHADDFNELPIMVTR